MDRSLDPRSIVTPYAFSVHPDLLGRPLATPWQRLGAILVDLVVIGFLTLIGASTLALGSALLLLWLALRKPGREIFGKIFRWAVGCLGLLVLATAVIVIWVIQHQDEIIREMEGAGSALEEPFPREAAEPAGEEREGGEDPVSRFQEAIWALRGLQALQDADTEEEAQAIADRLARTGRAAGLSMTNLREALTEAMPRDKPWSDRASRVVDRALGGLGEELPTEAAGEEVPAPGPEAPPGAAEEEAGQTEETADAPEEAELGPAAADSIALLQERLEEREAELRETRSDYERAREALAEAREEGGILAWFWNLVDELGLGFGWGALYLTITHAWWKGTSVGKRLFRIRVVMIDKRPLNWWLSFERAGGYAAGFATGLLGFVQIFWDPNRQAIHDKVSETIVIQDGKGPVPGPWIQEGKAQWSRSRGEVGADAGRAPGRERRPSAGVGKSPPAANEERGKATT